MTQVFVMFLVTWFLPLLSRTQAQDDAAQHFEKHVRPVLFRNCVSCHGPKKQESGLRLDSRTEALAGGDIGGPVIDLDSPANSHLLLAVRGDGDTTMPPDSKLEPEEIRAIEIWLKAGAPWPTDSTVVEGPTPAEAWKKHWAAQPVVAQPPPVVNAVNHVITPIDAFIRHRMKSSDLQPSPIADARTLIRRTHFVLTGLPPSRQKIEDFTLQFSADPEQAMRQLVDQLLESPHYGERWARHWLDLARYADTKGYVRLQEQPNFYYAYTYRDYVVNSFNADLPYNQFIREQLAADLLLTGDDNRSLAALSFLTLGRRFTGNQHDVIDDRIDVVTRGLMGITATCARCHDHKFDPIPMDDYYALYGVFASTTEPSDLPHIARGAAKPIFRGDMAVYRRKRKILDDQVDQYLPAALNMLRADTTRYLHGVLGGRKEFLVPLPAAKGELRQTFVERWIEYLEGTKRGVHPVFAAWHALNELQEEEFAATSRDIVNRLSVNTIVKDALQQTELVSMSDVASVYGRILTETYQKQVAADTSDSDRKPPDAAAEQQLWQVLYGADSPFAMSPREALDAYLLDAEQNRDLSQAYLTFDAWLVGTGQAPDRAHVLYDSQRVHEPHVFIRGNPERTGRQVPRTAPRLLGDSLSAPFTMGSGRLELANAIVSPDNPLTARVIVNRVWKHLFGTGLVQTTSNFGLRAAPPSHPRLLDHLAHQFMAEGWSLKKLHRRILLSSTWQQTSNDRPESRAIDPENRLLWRANRRRLDFETLRDTLLSVSGNLQLALGGPPLPLTDAENFRRTIYGHINRSSLPTMLPLFDFPSPDIHSPSRPRTTAPQQALYLLNNPFVMKRAELLARQAGAAENGAAATTNELYWRALGRPPSDSEVQQCQQYVDAGGQWSELAQTLMVSNEFLYVD
ncbi:MAG: DUF1553 domain-containing protein [Fuerstiella sp.]|jgi:mono/diheme cytochrome c family protein|nr:DUF1553 domain-containing protein [Fuerstiella sp.]MDG2130081.1 PSD1 and planctomycete cytochrome C domain-containing protein [Fuerstiella sp.]